MPHLLAGGFSELVLNPVAQVKFVHTVASGYVTGAMFILGISAWYMLKGRDFAFAKRSFAIAASFGMAAVLSVIVLGDEVLFDLKIMDATQARDVVKMNLPRVLENLRLLVSEGVNVIPRLPLIPGFTLSRENMQQALDVLIPLNIRHRWICW